MPEQGELLPRLRELKRDYLEKAETAERSASPMAGAFGTKGGPADDPCHERYAEALRALLEDCDQAAPQELAGLLGEILAPPARDCPRSAYWMLLAVQGLAETLIPRIDRADARALAERYRRDYPRYQRLPVQKQILRALKQRAE